MTSDDLHPLARDVLDTFATQAYFTSRRLANALAERNPTQCVRWACDLVEHLISKTTPHEIGIGTLSAIRDAIESPSGSKLSQLDELSWQSWSSASFDEASPFAQRAIARLGWAAMLLIGNATKANFESRFTGIHISANDHGAIK